MNQLVIKPAFGDIFLQRIQRFLRFRCVFPIVNSRFHEGSPSSRAMPPRPAPVARPSACPRHSNRMDDSNGRLDALKKENTRSNAANLAALSSAPGAVFAHGFVDQSIQFAASGRYFVSPPPGGGAELPITRDSGENSGDDVTLTRSELDALIDEAVRKDRTRR